MGMMVEAGGYKDTKELSARMQQGKVGIPELIKFINLLEKKSRESGAYQKGISTMQSAETRMGTSYTLFASQLFKLLETPLKDLFKFLQSGLDNFTKKLLLEQREKEKTGKVGTFETAIDLLIETFRTVVDNLDLIGETLWDISKYISEIAAYFGKGTAIKGTLKEFLQRKEMERAYFDKVGATSEQDKMKAKAGGMTGYGAFVKEKAIRLGATESQADAIAREYVGMSLGEAISPTLKTTPQHGFLPSGSGLLNSAAALGLVGPMGLLANMVLNGENTRPNADQYKNLMNQGLTMPVSQLGNNMFPSMFSSAKTPVTPVYRMYPTIVIDGSVSPEETSKRAIEALKSLNFGF